MIAYFKKSSMSVMTALCVYAGSTAGLAAKDLYVDAATGNDSRTAAEAGSKNTPWKTISKAAKNASAGDVVLIMPGVYSEQVSLKLSGTADQPITFKAFDPKNKPVLSGTAIVNRQAWEKVQITDFKGRKQTVYKTSIGWDPVAVFQKGKIFCLAMEPNPKNPADTYDSPSYMKVDPAQNPGSKTALVDKVKLTQPQKGYWKGATLMLFDGYINAVKTGVVTDYIPAQHKLVIGKLHYTIGSNGGREDKYALRNHLGLLDSPGEFYVDKSVKPYQIYIYPYDKNNTASITATKYNSGLDLRNCKYIRIDGLKITSYQKSGILMNYCDNVTIANCDLIDNRTDGLYSHGLCSNTTVVSCFVKGNDNNGISFQYGKNTKVIDCEVTENGNNGVWFGTGGKAAFTNIGILVKGCRIYRQSGLRQHPDNFQMHQCQDVVLDSNIMIQEHGHQNMWLVYSDNLTMKNNVIMGGTVGINSTIHSYLYNNVFVDSMLRYNAHLTNNPQRKDFYKPQEAIIRNNVIIEGRIDWPAANILDRFKVFTVDHNYYNIENKYARSFWEWKGYSIAMFQKSMALTNKEIPAKASVSIDMNNFWSSQVYLVLLYRNPQNYYYVGLSSRKFGVFRKMNGVDTCLDKDTRRSLIAPHAARGNIVINADIDNDGSKITLKISKEKNVLTVVDNDPNAVKKFTSGKIGAEMEKGRNTIISASAKFDGSEHKIDLDPAAKSGLHFTAVSGNVSKSSAGGGKGIGIGKGSIMHTKRSMLKKVFTLPPNKDYSKYDLTPCAGSPLIDAGIDVRLNVDIKSRKHNGKVDIGAYEK